MKFKKDFLVDELGLPDNPSIVQECTLVDSDRWTLQYEIIFEHEGKFYRTYYRVGATEYQDEQPWEYENEVDCDEVRQVERLVKVWEVV